MSVDDILHSFEAEVRRPKPQQQDLHALMTQAMVNERMAPELLPYKHELMATVLREIANQQQYLLDLHEYGVSNADAGVIGGEFKLQLMIIETDIERLSYLVRLYIRTRLSKIDDFTIYYLSHDSESLTSPLERVYMQRHFRLLTQLYNNSFLKKLPSHLALLDDTSGDQNMVAAPDVHQPVFIRVVTKEPITLRLAADDELELAHQGIYVVKYSLVSRHVELGDVVLI